MINRAQRLWDSMLSFITEHLRFETGPERRWTMSALKIVLVTLAIVVPGGTLVLLAAAAFTALRANETSRLGHAFARIRRLGR
jgi:hypothetical protein